jgi:RIO kinase 1
MAEPLALLLDDGVIDEVYTRLKSGKEADIYLVRHANEVVAAKVYKERNARNFKNNAAYKEGRRVRNTRTQRAMDKGSRFGQAASEEAWKAKEAEALGKLFAAGVRVPKPVMFYEGVLLMEAVLDSDGRPAPRLVEAAVPREKAAEWYADLRSQVVKMLACDLVHGDLSPYNVLVAWNGPTVIDFPQVIGAAHNSQAERFFERDLETLRRFFAAVDPALNASAGDAREIWRAFVRRELTPDFVPTGKGAPPERRPERRADGRHDRPHDRREPHEPGRPEQRRPQPERQERRQGGQAERSEPPRSQGHGQPQRPPRDDRAGPGRQDPRRGQHGQSGQQPRHGQPQQAPRQGQPQQQPRQGQPQPAQRPQGQPPQRQGHSERRGGDGGRRGSPGPQVSVIQRIPGVAPTAPKRDGGQGSGHGQGGPGGRPHGGHGHRRPPR